MKFKRIEFKILHNGYNYIIAKVSYSWFGLFIIYDYLQSLDYSGYRLWYKGELKDAKKIGDYEAAKRYLKDVKHIYNVNKIEYKPITIKEETPLYKTLQGEDNV